MEKKNYLKPQLHFYVVRLNCSIQEESAYEDLVKGNRNDADESYLESEENEMSLW